MIRKAKLSDIKNIVNLEQSCFRCPLPEEFITNDIKNNPLSNYLVYLENDEVVAYAGLWITDNIEILNFCVDIGYRRLKVGTKLLSNITEIADEKKLDICLEVRKSNEAAINLYSNNGFEVVLVRKGYYENKEDALLMIRKCKK